MDGMNNPTTPPNPPTPVAVNPGSPMPDMPKKAKKRVFLWVLLIIMTAAAGAFAWLYFNKQVESDDENSEQANVAQEAEDDSDNQSTPSKTSFEAEVGKYKLVMDADYVVIKRLDGGFEGGPATIVDVAEASDSPGVIDTNPAQSFTIFAKPEEGATLANNSRTFILEGDEQAERKADGEFADTTARIYDVEGLFSTRHVIFVKNGIVYEITLLMDNSAQTAIYQVVEAGFSFVE